MGMNMIAWAKMIGITPNCIHLQGDILAGTAILFAAYNTFGILHRHLTCTLHEQHRTDCHGK